MTSIAAIVIPVRFASTRFPGKPLADRTGRTLVQHVWEQASRAACAARVVVATDDPRIEQAVRTFGGECRMTRADHPNGTSRIAEVAETLREEIVVNVQGDEPEIDPATIDRAVSALEAAPECPMSTLACPLSAGDDAGDPNLVKVVLDRRGRALYFSRAAIPFDREGSGDCPPWRHVGLYAYRRSFLPRYVALTPTPLEACERLEQLRVLEHGFPIAVALVDAAPAGIDTPEQYEAFVRRFASGVRA
ncbi:MAG: 3-deoxy-manno-octulosonate cytidylyltransferase [Phycisphaerales bacterium]|nr:3-deoxy-manno-octulosonate cytidylyltransferase [Phycisphaerales bacterium]